jgi:NAD(P)H dehydrogenase (quinone)
MMDRRRCPATGPGVMTSATDRSRDPISLLMATDSQTCQSNSCHLSGVGNHCATFLTEYLPHGRHAAAVSKRAERLAVQPCRSIHFPFMDGHKMNDSLLVTGASGQLGQRVLAHLLDTLWVPPHRVIAATRTPESLAAWTARGVVARHADFDSDASLAGTFHGADRVLLISTDSDIPGHRIEQHVRAIRAAESSSVSHLIYTSMPDPVRSLVLFAPDHAATEAVIASSVLPGWTVLRNHWYFDNLFMTLPGVLARDGMWLSATGDGKLADISRDDLALAAAVELAGRSTGKKIYTLSGPEALTTSEQATLISSALGTPIHVVPVSPDALVRAMCSAGVPENLAQLLVSFDENVAVGRMGNITNDFETITGSKAQPLAQWLKTNAAALLAA